MSHERIEVPPSDLSSSGPSISRKHVHQFDQCSTCGALQEHCEPASVPPGPAAPPPEPLRALLEQAFDCGWNAAIKSETDCDGDALGYDDAMAETTRILLAALLAGPAAPQTAAPTEKTEDESLPGKNAEESGRNVGK